MKNLQKAVQQAKKDWNEIEILMANIQETARKAGVIQEEQVDGIFNRNLL